MQERVHKALDLVRVWDSAAESEAESEAESAATTKRSSDTVDLQKRIVLAHVKTHALSRNEVAAHFGLRPEEAHEPNDPRIDAAVDLVNAVHTLDVAVRERQPASTTAW
jgi:hypothetical protein